jgi:hypothetical protein
MVAGNGDHRDADRLEERVRPFVLAPAPAVGQVAGRDEDLGAHVRGQADERRSDLRVLTCTHVEIGDMQDACDHERMSVCQTGVRHQMSDTGDQYHSGMSDESAEIFDDLYLGLRAGGALRKQRRGEALTTEEQEALGRWQRLSTWRKAIAIGGFAVGTFGLGFTLGGLVFGRWRKA